MNGTGAFRLAVIALFTVALLGALSVVVGGCGGGSANESADRVSSCAAEGAADSAAVQQYRDDLQSWADKYLSNADYRAMEFSDYSQPSGEELDRAHGFADSMHQSVGALRRIAAPEIVAQAQAKLCSSIAREVAAVDRMIMAIENQNARDAQLAYRRMVEARTAELEAVNELQPYMEQAPVIEN